MIQDINDTIVALSTSPGAGAIAIVRISGPQAITICDQMFDKKLTGQPSHTLHFGNIIDSDGRSVDECVVSIFVAPKSYTRQDIVEISCHGSPYIIQEIIGMCLSHGARLAIPGEFTMRAYLNGQLDLAQAEAVADLIASQNSTQHSMAMSQVKGHYSDKINKLRDQMIHFASLIELENDFGEEDVEFANREELSKLIENSVQYINTIIDSFQYGNAIKKGIPVVIIGAPNVGKSTLLNALLEEDKAIVTSIPGTTRDYIEDTMMVGGIQFRFIDTAGLRDTDDEVENIGIERSIQQLALAKIVLFVVDYTIDYQSIVKQFRLLNLQKEQKVVILINKMDQESSCSVYDVEEAVSTTLNRIPVLAISAKEGLHLDKLKNMLVEMISSHTAQYDLVMTNSRHHHAMKSTCDSLTSALQALTQGLPSDLVAIDIRHASRHIGEITGKITTDDLLDKIFRDFCIGK